MNALTIYHNPKCSKSRAALSLLQELGLTPRIVEYLQSPPSAAELKAIVALLGIRPEELVRKGEEIYRTRLAGKTLTDDQWIAAMVRDPILIERPIVIMEKRAVLGRPPDTVLALLRD
ncbi:MAG: arsenate reductase (glutaredoxin) [Steroidobacteraceae bacterium]